MLMSPGTEGGKKREKKCSHAHADLKSAGQWCCDTNAAAQLKGSLYSDQADNADRKIATIVSKKRENGSSSSFTSFFLPFKHMLLHPGQLLQDASQQFYDYCCFSSCYELKPLWDAWGNHFVGVRKRILLTVCDVPAIWEAPEGNTHGWERCRVSCVFSKHFLVTWNIWIHIKYKSHTAITFIPQPRISDNHFILKCNSNFSYNTQLFCDLLFFF